MAHPLPLEVVTATNVAAAIQLANAFRHEVVLMLSVYPTWTAFIAALTGYGTHDDKCLREKRALMNTSQNQFIPTLLFNLIPQGLALKRMKSD
jgi:hypothetical protein